MINRLSPHLVAVLQALFVTFIWSTSWVFIKIGLGDIPPLTYAGLRYALAFLCLLPLIFQPVHRDTLRHLSRRQWLELVILGVIFIAITQGLDTDERNPVSRLLLHVLGAAAEFERSLILERSQAGQRRYRDAFQRGEVGRTVHGRSGRDLPPHRPRRIFDREAVISLHRQGLSLRQIARQLDLGVGTVSRTLKERSKSTYVEKDGAFTSACEPR